ncbi:acyltransferase family protein [Desulfobacula sp.]|uniref:acyltransferase family protein n=1 Tax=Desulfobacula sp. TaxID=2593537 RepID=UPI00260F382B|nr:acyltransferase family protein [Desulfobacula sp.]
MHLDVGRERIQYIDVARFYAMAGVFFGHFIERIMLLNDPTAATLYKFVYSFHMVLFFVLSGFIARDGDLAFSVGKFLKHRVLSRLLPFIFFTIVFMLLAAVFPGDFFNLTLPTVKGYIGGLISTGLGIPLFCVPSWFLLMLFSVEVVHYFAFRFLKSDSKILIGMVVFYIGGYFLNLNGDFMNFAKQRLYNVLFIHEAITMYAFYLLGVYLRRRKFLMEEMSLKMTIPAVIIAFLMVLFTFKLNMGPFNFNYFNSVVIMFSSHGNIFWFPLTAIAGSLLVFLLGKITPCQKTIVWMGQNTLILMCLNGVFYHFINPRLGKWVFINFAAQPLMIFGAGLMMTLMSLALCIPFIHLFNRYVPQLVGKPKINGPWLKNFI